MLTLPDDPFAEIAVDLALYAERAQRAVVDGELLLAKAGVHAPGTRDTMKMIEAGARRAAGLYAFFRDAAPFEAEIREFLTSLRKRRAA